MFSKATILSALTLATSTILASPIAARTDYFYLKSTNASAEAFNDLYFYSYHTGAGTGDAIGTSNISAANKAYLNGTSIEFAIYSSDEVPLSLSLYTDTNYAGESPSFSSHS